MSQVHNAIKYGSQILGGISVAAGIDRDGSGVERLGETLTPIMDAWRQPEWAYLMGVRLGAIQRTRALDAANFSFVGIQNPVGSGLIATVKYVLLHNANAAAANYFVSRSRTTVTVLGTLGKGRPLDTRMPIPGGTIVEAGDGVEAARTADADLYFVRIPGNDSKDIYDADLVLLPGFSCIVEADVINTSVRASWKWYERQALPGELIV